MSFLVNTPFIISFRNLKQIISFRASGHSGNKQFQIPSGNKSVYFLKIFAVYPHSHFHSMEVYSDTHMSFSNWTLFQLRQHQLTTMNVA